MGRKKMVSKPIREELRYLFPRTLIADAAVYLISLIFVGFNYDVILGLLLGTALLFLNLLMLGISTDNIIRRYSDKNNFSGGKSKAVVNYVLRYLVVFSIIAMVILVNLSWLFNIAAVIIPLFYPKLIYLIKSIISRKEE